MTEGRPPELHRVSLEAAAATPWRNGGGTTRELLTWPPAGPRSGDPSDWTLRVSVADITQDGPFSGFAGIERCFAVVEGSGVELDLHTGPKRLTVDDTPVPFDGALAPGCRLIDGATRDLNLMVKQARGRAVMQRARIPETWGEGLRWRALYAHRPARVDTAQGGVDLQAGTLLWSDGDAPAWRLIDGTLAWWLGMAPHSEGPTNGGP